MTQHVRSTIIGLSTHNDLNFHSFASHKTLFLAGEEFIVEKSDGNASEQMPKKSQSSSQAVEEHDTNEQICHEDQLQNPENQSHAKNMPEGKSMVGDDVTEHKAENPSQAHSSTDAMPNQQTLSPQASNNVQISSQQTVNENNLAGNQNESGLQSISGSEPSSYATEISGSDLEQLDILAAQSSTIAKGSKTVPHNQSGNQSDQLLFGFEAFEELQNQSEPKLELDENMSLHDQGQPMDGELLISIQF